MDVYVDGGSGRYEIKEKLQTRKGAWCEEEDSKLVDYVNNHGEGRWDSLARSAGLHRTGKSCRFRWLNYLRPGIRRGNFSLQEQLKILELHFLWGNRWSKIAQYFPGRTDNEIKNYWRTRVEKQARHLKCEVNSKQFKETMRNVLMPRLVDQILISSGSSSTAISMIEPSTVVDDHCSVANSSHDDHQTQAHAATSEMAVSTSTHWDENVESSYNWLQDDGATTCSHSQSLDDLVLDNLWNWNDDAIFPPPAMNYVLN
ncbi:hypothetical protein FNV43_RR23666 [Rhamnella rubrinervis]|uniref:Uncharacterized protein n=1 Tax=Rhamnella rubrinervis TaxID=2594499 RepID=A0A8K0DYJ5_9ROSA|nr:hypothetical protein FNV43_RR23666 [Rhamnella rubrinervis]